MDDRIDGPSPFDVEQALERSRLNTAVARAQLALARGETISPQARGELERMLGRCRRDARAAHVVIVAADAAFAEGEMPDGFGLALERRSAAENDIGDLEGLLRAHPQRRSSLPRARVRSVPLALTRRVGRGARSACSGNRRRPGVRRTARSASGPPGKDDGSGESDPPGGDSAGSSQQGFYALSQAVVA